MYFRFTNISFPVRFNQKTVNFDAAFAANAVNRGRVKNLNEKNIQEKRALARSGTLPLDPGADIRSAKAPLTANAERGHFAAFRPKADRADAD